MKPRPEAQPSDDEADADAEAVATAEATARLEPTVAIEPRAGLPVVEPGAMEKLEARSAHPLRALLAALVWYTKLPAAKPMDVGGGYRGGQVRLAVPASGAEGEAFEAAGLRLIGALRERAGVLATSTDVHVDEAGAVYAVVRQTRTKVELSSYYLFSMLSDGTVIETVQAKRAFTESTPGYECRPGKGNLADDLSAHRAAVGRLCRVRGVYVVAVRDLDDVVRQQRFVYRHALPMESVRVTLLVALAPVLVPLALLLLYWDFFVR